MPNQLSFFEVAQILQCNSNPEHIGKSGIVIGKSDEEADDMAYTLYLADAGEACLFFEWEVAGTGKIVPKSEVYSGESIRVRVAEDGEGYEVDPADSER